MDKVDGYAYWMSELDTGSGALLFVLRAPKLLPQEEKGDSTAFSWVEKVSMGVGRELRRRFFDFRKV